MILGEQQLRDRFERGESVIRALAALADGVGAMPIADYTWDVAADSGPVRHMRRVTPVGLVGVTEEPPSAGHGWSLRVQVVSWKASGDIAIVWHQTPDDGYWEMHLGDGHPQRIKADNVPAATDFVSAALAAVIPDRASL